MANNRQEPEIDTTSISLAAPIMAAGRRRAAQLFKNKRGGNFSGYLEWLIQRDLNSISPGVPPFEEFPNLTKADDVAAAGVDADVARVSKESSRVSSTGGTIARKSRRASTVPKKS